MNKTFTPLHSHETRPTVAKVNLSHLSHNLNTVRQRIHGRKIMAIVKANAYGHGLITVARQFIASGADQLGVAFLEEGVALRQAGIQHPVLVMGGILNHQIGLFLDHNLELTVSSLDKLRQVEEVAANKRKTAVIHLKIDTGMERIGVHSYSCGPFIEAALKTRHCHIKGIYSHLACADEPESPMTLEQVNRFQDALQHFERLSEPMPLRHLANSAGILHFPETLFDLVRPGIMLYGVSPNASRPVNWPLKPALSLVSTVVYFKVVKAQRPISYGATWQSDKPIRVITVPIGYGDGYKTELSGKGQVLVRGHKYPIVGRVCMDQLMVNLNDGTAYNGDEVTLIGQQQDQYITVEELASQANVLTYEILTSLNQRIPRVYID